MLKKYPADYSKEILNVLHAMSFTNGKHLNLVGTYTVRSQVYAGDVDAFESVPIKTIKNTAERFQDLVKRVVKLPFTYISDIKCGSVDEWIVIPETTEIRNGKVEGYNSNEILIKVKELYERNIIDNKQLILAKKLLKEKVNIVEFVALQKELRYNIIRWSLQDIIAGYKTLQDGRQYTLEEGIQADTITKLDVVSWISGNRFTEFEVIYIFKSGNRIINKGLGNYELAVKTSILFMESQGNYFKMAKRMYAISRYHNYKRDSTLLSDLFTGDLGKLYSIYGDTDSLIFLIENIKELPKDKISFEIDYFITRLSNVSLPLYMNNEKKITSIVNRLTNKKIYTYENNTMIRLLKALKSEILEIISIYSFEYLQLYKLYPIPSKYLI